jgi:NDP-sugar pyrophosphorylase family protein
MKSTTAFGNNSPCLLIMAAGLGSRYGGFKQFDELGPCGEKIMDYTLFDALKCGFEQVVVVVSESNEKQIQKRYVPLLKGKATFSAVVQSKGARTKPWGTGHAVLSARKKIEGSFAVLNADDYYSPEAVQLLFKALKTNRQNKFGCMVAYPLRQTLSKSGAVSRAVCVYNENNVLYSIREFTHITANQNGGVYAQEGDKPMVLDPDAAVSMNCWGFSNDFFNWLEIAFKTFLIRNKRNQQAEFYLPSAVQSAINSKQLNINLLHLDSIWFGLTYPGDRLHASEHLDRLTKNKQYPSPLWT